MCLVRRTAAEETQLAEDLLEFLVQASKVRDPKKRKLIAEKIVELAPPKRTPPRTK